MANKQRGEVDVSAGGKNYALKLSTNAICELETATGKGINEFASGLNDVSKFKLTDLRLIVWAMLNGGSGSSVDIQLAGDIIDDLGMDAVMEKVTAAFQLAFPEMAGDDAGKSKAAA